MSIARDLPPFATQPDVRTHSGRRVVVTGTHRQIDIPMRRKGSSEHLGFAAIQLQDGIDLLRDLSWSPSARRSEAERRRFDGQQIGRTKPFVQGVGSARALGGGTCTGYSGVDREAIPASGRSAAGGCYLTSGGGARMIALFPCQGGRRWQRP
jgi:hypothetical protein